MNINIHIKGSNKLLLLENSILKNELQQLRNKSTISEKKSRKTINFHVKNKKNYLNNKRELNEKFEKKIDFNYANDSKINQRGKNANLLFNTKNRKELYMSDILLEDGVTMLQQNTNHYRNNTRNRFKNAKSFNDTNENKSNFSAQLRIRGILS